MKVITSQVGYTGTEFFVLKVGMEPVKIDFVQQIDDLMVSSPEGNILLSWDLAREDVFDENQSMLIQKEDHLKEINNLKSTNIVVRAWKESDGEITVFITGQRN